MKEALPAMRGSNAAAGAGLARHAAGGEGSGMGDAFDGSKAAVFLGERLLVYLRDDRPDISWPGHWDFPGGGREGSETPEETLFREIEEEFGLRPAPGCIVSKALHPSAGPRGGVVWFFVLELPVSAEDAVVFGEEGQDWRLMPPEEYLVHPRAVPHLAQRLSDWLAEERGREDTRPNLL